MATMIRKIGKRVRYPWKEWTDGRARRARRGKDFRCSAYGFRSTLYTHADRHKLTVNVSIVSEKSVDFQFAKPAK